MATKKKVDDEKPEEKAKKKKPSDDRVSNLEKKVGEMSATISQQNEFIQGASTVINTLAYNPELRAKFQEVYHGKGMVHEGKESVQQSQAQPEAKGATGGKNSGDDELIRKVDEVSLSRREEIVKNFEDKVGITEMKEAEKNDARKKLESYFNRFGMSVKSNPLPTLQENLEDAYLGTLGRDKLKEEGKLEGIAEFQTNRHGAMGTIGGGAPESAQNKAELTEKQKDWASKLGVSETKAQKRYLSRDQEETRVSGGEKRANK